MKNDWHLRLANRSWIPPMPVLVKSEDQTQLHCTAPTKFPYANGSISGLLIFPSLVSQSVQACVSIILFKLEKASYNTYLLAEAFDFL